MESLKISIFALNKRHCAETIWGYFADVKHDDAWPKEALIVRPERMKYPDTKLVLMEDKGDSAMYGQPWELVNPNMVLVTRK